jgi:hypothetical protein
MLILKEEINASTAHVLDLAKWKLVAVAGVGVVGLGWSRAPTETDPSAVLLLFSVGFLCAYVDLLIYRRLASLHAVAHYLREYRGEDPELRELKGYELEIKKRRDAGQFWISEELAHFLSSLTFSVSVPAVAYFRYTNALGVLALGIPAVGVALVVALFLSYSRSRHVLLE